MKFIKENWKMLIAILLIVILFPSIILIASNNKLLSYNTAIAIIGYGGSILGGFLTLYGVWWTIKEQNNNLIKQQEQLDKQRREDLAIQYRPIIIENVVSCSKENNIICFTNVGRGELLNVKVYSTNKNIVEVKIRDTKLVGTIPVGGSIEVICFCKFNKYNYLLDNHSEKKVSIIIKGDNIFKNQKIIFEYIYRTSIQGDDKPVLNSHNTIYSFNNFNEDD